MCTTGLEQRGTQKSRQKQKGKQRLQRTFQWMFSNGNGCSLLRSVSTESVHYFISPVARTLSLKQISPHRFGAILIIGLALVPEHVALYGTRHRGGGNTNPTSVNLCAIYGLPLRICSLERILSQAVQWGGYVYPVGKSSTSSWIGIRFT